MSQAERAPRAHKPPDLSPVRRGSLEFTIFEIGELRAVSRMPVTESMLNPFGTVNAGAMIWMADVTASALAWGPEARAKGEIQSFPLALDLVTHLVSNVRDGEILAEATFVRRGSRVSVVRTRVTCGDKLLCEVTTTHLRANA